MAQVSSQTGTFLERSSFTFVGLRDAIGCTRREWMRPEDSKACSDLDSSCSHATLLLLLQLWMDSSFSWVLTRSSPKQKSPNFSKSDAVAYPKARQWRLEELISRRRR